MTVIDMADHLVRHEVTISSADMGWLATALLAAAADNEIYGPQYHARVWTDGTSLDAIAMDPYHVHHLHIELDEEVDTVDVVVPRDALEWAKKNARLFRAKKDSLIHPVARFVFLLPMDPDSDLKSWVSIVYQEWDDENAPSARFDAPLYAEAYPPAARIIDAARTAEPSGPVPLSLDHLSDARTIATAFSAVPVIQYTRRESGKPGPAILDFWEGQVLRGTALISPISGGDGGDS
ncbi:MAG: hypothetical protein LBE05_05880 [Microbacterium sp.]|jgi:hypothetical protein|nr:hypothetical protein [Microbacterium sp.]